jgi:hypothetical protein
MFVPVEGTFVRLRRAYLCAKRIFLRPETNFLRANTTFVRTEGTFFRRKYRRRHRVLPLVLPDTSPFSALIAGLPLLFTILLKSSAAWPIFSAGPGAIGR